MKPAKSGSGARKKKEKSANEIIEEPAGRKGKQNSQLKNDPGPSGWVKGLDYFYNFSKLVDSKNASLRKIYQGVESSVRICKYEKKQTGYSQDITDDS